MNLMDKFETKFLFNIVRAIFLLLIFALLAVIVLGGLNLKHSMKNADVNTKVTVNDVLMALKEKPESNAAPGTNEEDILSSSRLTIPQSLKDYIYTPTFKVPFNNWLKEIPVEERQGFIDEIGAVMANTLSNSKNLSESQFGMQIANSLNKYADLKIEKINEKAKAKSEMEEQYKWYAIGTVIAIALVSLFSLVLVLLAIERNTRASTAIR